MHGDSASSSTLPDSFRLAGWTVVPSAHEMVRPGETVHVEPKPMDVLVLLASRAGEAVSRDELMDVVWPGVYVTDHALNRCVSRLRKLFDDNPRDPRVIETIPKAGYRLVAPVEALGDSALAPLDALDLQVAVHPGSPSSTVPARSSGWRLGMLAVGLGVLALAGWWATRSPDTAEPPATQALTVNPGIETDGAWSPDGTHLAYVHQLAESPLEPTRLMVRSLADDAPLVLTEGHYDRTPAWSPDGTQIAFIRCEDQRCRPYAVSALGTEERRLSDTEVLPSGLAWTPDGTTLIVALPAPAGLARLDLATGAFEPITQPDGRSRDVFPRLSPDGSRLAFKRAGLDGPDLYVVDAAGGDPLRLTTDRIGLPGYTWSGDGERILFSSARSGVYALWQIEARAGAEPEPLVGPAVRDPGGVDLRNGRLVVADWIYEINLWRSVDGSAPERIVASTLWDRSPALSPDGRQLAFISNRTGPPELWVSDADGENLVRLTDLGGPSVEAPQWSPDGQTLAVVARIDGPASLHLVSAEGGTLRPLTESPTGDVAPRWSRDGRSILFGSRRSGTWEIWRVPVEGGDPQPVTQTGGLVAEELPDGSLLVAKAGEGGLWRVADGLETQVSDLPALSDTQSWVWTSSGVLVPDRTRGEVVRLRLDGSPPVSTGIELGAVFTGEASLAASADGQTTVIARTDRIEADLLVTEPVE
ncbi:MAG: winged helix-turn-helix domain-containing protein [Bacteroidota bacterium]